MVIIADDCENRDSVDDRIALPTLRAFDVLCPPPKRAAAGWAATGLDKERVHGPIGSIRSGDQGRPGGSAACLRAEAPPGARRDSDFHGTQE